MLHIMKPVARHTEVHEIYSKVHNLREWYLEDPNAGLATHKVCTSEICSMQRFKPTLVISPPPRLAVNRGWLMTPDEKRLPIPAPLSPQHQLFPSSECWLAFPRSVPIGGLRGIKRGYWQLKRDSATAGQPLVGKCKH